LNRSGGIVNLIGTLNNAGTTLALGAATGSWVLLGGTVAGGTVSESGGPELGLTPSGGTLNGGTIVGPVDLTPSNSYATVLGGLTLDGTATVGAGARLYFDGTQTLGGTGTVDLENEPGTANGLVSDATGMTLTIGPGITVRGGSSDPNGAVIGYNYA